MSDEDLQPSSPDPAPDPPEPERGLLARARGHLMDLTPLRESRDFRLLFLGKSVSDLGDEIVATVVPFQVYQLTHSTLAVGLLGLCALVPVFVFPIIGGAFADAVERRRFVIVMHALLAVMSALMAVNAMRDEPLLWPLYVFATLSAGLYTFNRPAMSTWPARLLPPDLLPSSNALEVAFHTIAAMGGPVLAGILILTIEPAGAFVFDVFSFLFVIAMVWRMKPSPPSDEEASVSWAAIVDGFRFLKGKRTIQSVFGIDLIAMIFGFPMALFPAIAEQLGHGSGAGVLGLLYAAPAFGAFLATLFSGRAKHVRRQGPGDHARGDHLGSRDRGVRAVEHAVAVARDAHDRRRRRHAERHLPLDDPAGRRRRLDPRPARRHRDGRVGDRTVARRSGVRRRRLDLERARQRGLGRPAHDRSASACSGCSCRRSRATTPKHPVP